MNDSLRKIQGICGKCAAIIDKNRIITDKPTARIYCKKCLELSETKERCSDLRMKKYRKRQLVEVVSTRENGDVCVQNEGNPEDRWIIDKDTFEKTYEQVSEE